MFSSPIPNPFHDYNTYGSVPAPTPNPRVRDLLRVFGVKEDFLNVLTATNSFLAGGAMTHLFVEKPLDTFDGDLDVWVPHSLPREGAVSSEAVELFATKQAVFRQYLTSAGYTPTETNSLRNEYTTTTSTLKTEIRKILSFVHPTTHRQIQVIFAFGDWARILSRFDFSFCAVGFDPKIEVFFGLCLELTRTMRGVTLNLPRDAKRNAMRLEKYVKRGFTLLDAPAAAPTAAPAHA